jgi:uncharacterized protein (TIGR04255 family)
MALPSSKRVVFRRNPLFGVSVQVRFHPILRIQVETPAKFQEAIRSQFAGYMQVDPATIAVPPGLPAEVQAAMRTSLQGGLGISLGREHRFVSGEGNWWIQLSQDSLTMVCKVYPRWEEFRDKFRPVFDSFVSIYVPPFATGVGLRYQNAIERSKLGLSGVGWSDLLQPFIAAEFNCPGLSEADIHSDLHRFEFSEGQDRIFVQHGMAKNKLTSESVYSIDCGFNAMGKVDLTDVFSRLDQLNRHSGSLFRLCITDRLFNSLEPVDG